MKVFDISTGWPCGISDGLSLNCGVCGEYTNLDYTVDDEIWNEVVPDNLRLGVVCLNCFDGLCKKYGEFLGNHLIQIQYTGINETVVLKPDISFVYEGRNA